MHTSSVAAEKSQHSNSGFSRIYVWGISGVAALGGLLFGYDWVVIGGAKPFYEKFFALTDPSIQGWAMSCALVGCFLGTLAAGPASDRYGRKKPLLVSALLFAISSLATGLASSFPMFIAWRIIGGVAIGLASSLSPLYIAEVAPAELRGTLVSMNQFTIVIGILLAQLVNWRVADPVPAGATAAEILNSWNGQVGWRWMFGLTVIPSLVFLIGASFLPESPRWLVGKGKKENALSTLEKISGPSSARSVLQEIEGSLRDEKSAAGLSELFQQKYGRVLLLGIVLAVFQQWCGINVIFNYAEEIFSSAGYTVSDILFNIVITGGVNVLSTILAIYLVDRVGRRALMIGGAASLTVVYAALGLCYALHIHGVYVLALVLLAIACYAVSLAPVVWVVISEIFPNRIRGVAISVAVGFLWIACFALTFTFPILNGAFGAAGTFWLYSAICLAGLAFVFFRLPETKGKSLEELEGKI